MRIAVVFLDDTNGILEDFLEMLVAQVCHHDIATRGTEKKITENDRFQQESVTLYVTKIRYKKI